MPMTKNLVSIIMPAFNCEHYIRESIDSVINQTYKEWELIIIDDCSTDNTLSIINEYKNIYSNIVCLKNPENLGVSNSRNKGINCANGEWVAFLDSDDIWQSNKLEKQLKHQHLTQGDFFFTGSSFINEYGTPYKGIFEVPNKVSYKVLKKQNVISCSSVLIKKTYFEKIKMERDDIHEDYAVWLKVLKNGDYAYGLNEPLLIYRISKKSKSGNKIKTIKMTYNVFRFVGYNKFKSFLYLSSHLIRSLKKYKNIKI